jgi:hypothetical protein
LFCFLMEGCTLHIAHCTTWSGVNCNSIKICQGPYF